MPLVKSFFWDANFSAQLQSIQYITFDSVEGTPPVPVSEIDEECQELVEEMRKYAERFLGIVQGRRGVSCVSSSLPSPFSSTQTNVLFPTINREASGESLFIDTSSGGDEDHELMEFWLRKTRKPVLAVVLVRKSAHGARLFYRAMNLEVSMPTGSLCSERAAIATALAADPGLRRRDIRMVAVLSLPKLDHPDPTVAAAYQAAGVATLSGTEIYRSSNPSVLPPLHLRTPHKAPNPEDVPCAMDNASTSVAATAASASDPTPTHLRQMNSALLVSASGSGNAPAFELPFGDAIQHMHVTPESAVAAILTSRKETRAGRTSPAPVLGMKPADAAAKVIAVGLDTASVEPRDAMASASCSLPTTNGAPDYMAPAVAAKAVPVALNPIAPCGSCMEWLRKIAEANPDFKVLNFTDISCTRVFIKPVPM